MYGKRDSIHHHLPEANSEAANVQELSQKLLYTTPFGWWVYRNGLPNITLSQSAARQQRLALAARLCVLLHLPEAELVLLLARPKTSAHRHLWPASCRGGGLKRELEYRISRSRKLPEVSADKPPVGIPYLWNTVFSRRFP